MNNTVRARLAEGRSVSADDFADITNVPVERVAWEPDGTLAVTFAETIPPEAVAKAERRIVAPTRAAEGDLAAIAAAMADTELDPTARLTFIVEALARLALANP